MTELYNQLIYAVMSGDLEETKDLLSKGANVNTDYGYPLCAAIDNDNVEIAKLLIENGAEVTDNALQTAKANGHTEMVEFLKNEQRSKQND